MAVVDWLHKSVELAQKEAAKIDKDIIELFGLKPMTKINIKKYLSISTEERMARNKRLTDKLISVQKDISELLNLIAIENTQNKRRGE